MVSQRCIASVKNALHELNAPYEYVTLGEAKILSEFSESEMRQLKESLSISGFEILNNKKSENALRS